MNDLWIEYNEKAEYNDSLKNGLIVFFENAVNLLLKDELLAFCKWIRKNYWFPIRLNIRFLSIKNFLTDVNSKKKHTAVFNYQTTWDDKNREEKILPKIYIATGNFDSLVKDHAQIDIFFNYCFSIAHEITHYYQWFFYEFDKRTNRSLEIEANKWGRYIASLYCHSKDN